MEIARVERDPGPTMVQAALLSPDSLKQIADEVARALSYAQVTTSSAFVTTAVTYPNGSAAVVRLDQEADGFFVSDDGYGALTAEMMGALPTFNKVAPKVAERAGVNFDQRSFFILRVQREQLPAAVSAIANVSARAVERTIYALDQARHTRARATFEDRMHQAFGKTARFNERVRGAQGEWEFDGVVTAGDGHTTVFEFVAPAYSSVASANLKLGDVAQLDIPPRRVVALADYQRTDASLRAVLSTAADILIGVSDEATRYKQAA